MCSKQLTCSAKLKKILCISGSANEASSNTKLLRQIALVFADCYEFEVYEGLQLLPLFSPQSLQNGIPPSIQELKTKMIECDAVIISTPEYLYNVPAVLKNILEWMTESGELDSKPVLPITFTPAPPRGEFAMQSLTNSLKAVKSKVVAELPLYQNEIRNENGEVVLNTEHEFLLREALALL